MLIQMIIVLLGVDSIDDAYVIVPCYDIQ